MTPMVTEPCGEIGPLQVDRALSETAARLKAEGRELEPLDFIVAVANAKGRFRLMLKRGP
jgi:hypothetical protein